MFKKAALAIYNSISMRPRISAFSLGLLSALALPPVTLWPILFITFTAFFVILQQSPTTRTAAARAFLFAFGFHIGGLYWIAHSMLVDAAKFWWAVPLAVIALPAYFALYAALSGAVWQILRTRWNLNNAGQIFLFIPFWMLAEIARNRFFTGFEWNLIGSVWNDALPLLQSLSLFGIYGLSVLTLLFVFTPYLWAAKARRSVIIILIIYAGLFAWGTHRLTTTGTAYVPNVQLRLVQPNIAQELKWDPAERANNFHNLLSLSDTHAALTPTHIIWPEAAVPFIINQNMQALLEIGLRAPDNGLVITGGVWRDDLPGGTKRYGNGISAITSIGSIAAHSDKFHLVPFGEYFPARAWLAAHGININSIAAGATDFTPGNGPHTMKLKGLPPVSPLICYEVVYSGQVVDEANRPAWLLNITNDAWFGTTSGPYQHFASARFRAIEEGLPLVRVANTGISGVIDPLGRIVAVTKLNDRVSMDHGLPEAVEKTLFADYGHMLFIIMIAFLGLVSVRFRK